MRITITTPLSTVADFYAALGKELALGERRIRNADALADLLREKKVTAVRATSWGIPLSDALLVLTVFKDLRIGLRLS